MPNYSGSRHLPLGVAILAVLIGLVGIIYVLLGLLVILAVSFTGYSLPLVSLGGVIGGAVILVVGLVMLFVAVGLWGLRLWALVLSILVVGALWLNDILGGGFFTLGGIFFLVLLVYLIAVHREFR